MKDIDFSILKKNIRILMVQKDISQTDLANAIGMSQSNLSKRLSKDDDSNRFTLEQIWAIADYFSLPIDKLLGRQSNEFSLTPRNICRIFVSMIEADILQEVSYEREEHVYGYNGPIGHTERISQNYPAFIFPKYFYPDPDLDAEVLSDVQSDMMANGNDLPGNTSINDFFNKYFEAKEKLKNGEYSQETYDILMDAYYKILEE